MPLDFQDKPLPATALAKEIGYSARVITAMRTFDALHNPEPLAFDYGARCTTRHALRWLKAHPAFRSTWYFARHRKR